ncbi:hypothetical protein FIV42_14030 [Persicimonas caeni]|uniref:Twin-arginine translocase subunit TatB n=1 Tax=Persicimonas caeni TaxID=2292766 RepID=A0A4Y6PUP6_PERCE|nr:twin-arginine translocase TatA/TatE family subunit [Persicimonas caeni]QDG51819.1 hypothetical protein FIV42_14030 [Persicimonas caeni]QED33040.1 hypothetical protein FRD00_14025 [Persicimonas caeni]
MFSGLGLAEILLILLVALVVVGPEKIPDMARMLGKGVREARRASNMFRDMFMIEETGNYRDQDRRKQLHEERREVGENSPGVAGTVSREQTARALPPMRPVLIDPPRRATHTNAVELAAAGESTACTFETLTAARSA